MEINPIIQRITLPTRTEPAARPDAELLIDSLPYDNPYEPEPFWNLYDVVPAVIATAGKSADRYWARTGLRVGMLMITQFEVYPSTDPLDPAHTVDVSPGNGTTFYHQLADIEGEQHEVPGLLNGGRVFWGDNQTSNVDSNFSAVQHTYGAAGTYDIKLELFFASTNNFAWSNNPSAVRRIEVP